MRRILGQQQQQQQQRETDITCITDHASIMFQFLTADPDITCMVLVVLVDGGCMQMLNSVLTCARVCRPFAPLLLYMSRRILSLIIGQPRVSHYSINCRPPGHTTSAMTGHILAGLKTHVKSVYPLVFPCLLTDNI